MLGSPAGRVAEGRNRGSKPVDAPTAFMGVALDTCEISPDAVKAAPKTASGLASTIKVLVSRSGVIALTMCTGILTARALKPEGRGELAAMILWPVFLAQAFTLGLPSSLLYSLCKKKTSDRSLIGTAMLLGLILSAITTIAGVVLLPRWLVNYPAADVRMAQWFMISTPATILLLIGRSALEARGKFGTSSFLYLSAPLFAVVGLVALLVSHRFTAISAAWVYVLSGIPPLVIILYGLWKDLWPRGSDIPGVVRELMSYGIRSYGIDLCGSLAQYVDQALVLKLLMPAEMGSYVVALSLSRIINVIFTSVTAVLLPKAVNQDLASNLRLSLRALIASLMLAIPCSTALLLGSGTALHLLYGKEYLIANGLLKILICEAILSGSVTVMSQLFMAIGRPGTVTLLQVAGLATAIPMMTVLVPRFGSAGAGIALVISAVLRAFLLWLSYRRILPAMRVPVHHQIWDEVRHIVRTQGEMLARLSRPSRQPSV
jgi:O-antigen/teichoic acid export membrane protein